MQRLARSTSAVSSVCKALPVPLDELPDTVALRDPAHQVSPRAIGYWRTTAALTAVVEIAVAVAVYAFVPARPWWATVLLALLVVVNAGYVIAMPSIRFRVHRWEVSPTAVHTRSGWITTETRIAPIGRVQTVDSHQGALMRLFRLASLTVTTASAAGPITIAGLDQDQAREVVATLTAITGASEGDAT